MAMVYGSEVEGFGDYAVRLKVLGGDLGLGFRV